MEMKGRERESTEKAGIEGKRKGLVGHMVSPMRVQGPEIVE